MGRTGRPVIVLGLDSVPPSLLLDRFRDELPNFQRLLGRSLYGPLRTTDPPITVPAWAVMFTGVDPGTLGVYGFRHRPPGQYQASYMPTPATLRRPPLWDILSRRGRRVAVLGVPPGYPPPVVNGVYLGDFHTPPGAADAVYPASLREDLERALGEPFRFDVEFRVEDRSGLLPAIRSLTRQRFALAREIYRREPWDLFILHDIGPDRFHHAFWKYFDPDHPRHEPGNRYLGSAREYYRLLDEEVGRFLEGADPDSVVLVASDHGSKAMEGCFAVNDWLVSHGYLTLRRNPDPGTPLEKADVDWDRTRVWGAGGYYARLWLNLRGRETQGIVEADEVPGLLRDLSRELEAVRTPTGGPMGVRLLRPQDIYTEVKGDPPDLIAYFGDLSWRSAGTVGHPSHFLLENDTGPDDAVHDWDGVYVLTDPGRPLETPPRPMGPRESIRDVAPTLLGILGEPPPPWMQGRPIEAWMSWTRR